jgi:thiopeptide-type bacteriocin biosynthesis protein
VSRSERGTWLYLMFFPGKRDEEPSDYARLEQVAEIFLSDYALPTLASIRMEGGCDKYFYIRYAEGGYHLRLRCRCLDQASLVAVRLRLEGAIDRFLAEHPDAIADAVDSASLTKDGRLIESCYEPEQDKYCGPHGMLVVEDHFEHCTRLAADVLLLSAGGLRKDHIALWLLGQALPAAGLSPHETTAILSGHSRYWWAAFGRDHESVKRVLEQKYREKELILCTFLPDQNQTSSYARTYPLVEERLGAVRDLYRETIGRLCALEDSGMLMSSMAQQLHEEVAASEEMPSLSRYPLTYLLILPNLIHMMNNRLGIDIIKESQLAYFAGRYFQDQCDRPPAVLQITLEPSLRT